MNLIFYVDLSVMHYKFVSIVCIIQWLLAWYWASCRGWQEVEVKIAGVDGGVCSSHLTRGNNTLDSYHLYYWNMKSMMSPNARIQMFQNNHLYIFSRIHTLDIHNILSVQYYFKKNMSVNI